MYSYMLRDRIVAEIADDLTLEKVEAIEKCVELAYSTGAVDLNLSHDSWLILTSSDALPELHYLIEALDPAFFERDMLPYAAVCVYLLYSAAEKWRDRQEGIKDSELEYKRPFNTKNYAGFTGIIYVDDADGKLVAQMRRAKDDLVFYQHTDGGGFLSGPHAKKRVAADIVRTLKMTEEETDDFLEKCASALKLSYLERADIVREIMKNQN